LKTQYLKKMSIPKITVLATGMAGALLAATMSPQAATASPSQQSDCSACHPAGGSLTATPSGTSIAGGAAYTVALAYTGGTGSPAGFWISGNGANVTGSSATSAAMTAPAAAGTYTYTVWVRSGSVASATYSITVAGTGTAPSTPAAGTAPSTPAGNTVPNAPALVSGPGVAADPAAASGAGTVADPSALIPVGAPDTGAGGAAKTE